MITLLNVFPGITHSTTGHPAARTEGGRALGAELPLVPHIKGGSRGPSAHPLGTVPSPASLTGFKRGAQQVLFVSGGIEWNRVSHYSSASLQTVKMMAKITSAMIVIFMMAMMAFLIQAQPVSYDQQLMNEMVPSSDESEGLTSEDVIEGSWKEKRPFCNAFAGCGRKRSFQEMKRLASESLLLNYPRNADLKLWDKLFSKLQNRYRSNIKD